MTRLRRTLAGCEVAAIAVAAACKGGQSNRAPQATPVRVSPASRIDAPVTVSASGVVEPMQTVAVTTQVSGSLLNVLFREGDFVQKGQRLFQIDPRPLQAAVDQSTATLNRDQAQAAAAARDDARYKQLADTGYVSRSQSDQMHATALAAAATVRADQAALRAAQVNLGFTTIRAPIAGRTGGLLVRMGNNVSPNGGPLVVINQLNPVLVRFPVLEQDFAPMQSAVAQHALPVTAASNDSTQAIEHGTLSFLDNNVDSLTGTVTGKANFANQDRALWPGELVFLTVQLRIEHDVVAVPTDAILTGQQGAYVFIVDQKNTARMQTIVPGLQLAEMTVVQRGLTAGERVVVDGQSRLNAGTRVAITGVGTDTSAATLSSGVDSSGAPRTLGGEIVPGTNQTSASRGGAGAAGGVSAGQVNGANPSAARGASPAQAPGVGTATNGANGANGGAAANGALNPTGTNPANGTNAPSTMQNPQTPGTQPATRTTTPTTPLTTPPAARPTASPTTPARGRPPGLE